MRGNGTSHKYEARTCSFKEKSFEDIRHEKCTKRNTKSWGGLNYVIKADVTATSHQNPS